jgi:hypothetical protein
MGPIAALSYELGAIRGDDRFGRFHQAGSRPAREWVPGGGAAGIPDYWIVNLVHRQVEVYTSAGPAGYASRQDFASGQQVPLVIGGRQVGLIAVDDLLP